MAVLVIGAVLMSGCVGGPEEAPSGGTTPAEKQAGGEPTGQSTGGWCSVGATYLSPQGEGKFTGIEKETFNGKTVDLCCAEITKDGEVKNKVCNSKDEEYFYCIGRETVT